MTARDVEVQDCGRSQTAPTALNRTMHELGYTRCVHRHNHLVLTPDTFVRAPLPGMRKATAIIHVAPAAGSRFTQFTAEFEKDGLLGGAAVPRFVYVLEGELTIGASTLSAADFAYLPAG